jgi:hypothetical protein
MGLHIGLELVGVCRRGQRTSLLAFTDEHL